MADRHTKGLVSGLHRLPRAAVWRILDELIDFAPIDGASFVEALPERPVGHRLVAALRLTTQRIRQHVDSHRRLWFICRPAVRSIAENTVNTLRLAWLADVLAAQPVLIDVLACSDVVPPLLAWVDARAGQVPIDADVMTEDGWDEVLLAASWEGLVNLARTALAAGASPAIENQKAVVQAAAKGHTDVLSLLIADPRCDPAASANRALRCAARAGFDGAVRVLLADRRVNPAAYNDQAIVQACTNGHEDVVRLLLEDGRVNVAVDSGAPLRAACGEGHAAVVRLLLQHPKVNPAAKDHHAIQMAARHGRLEVLLLLLIDGRMTHAARRKAAKIAERNGHVDAVRLLGRNRPE